MDWLTFFALTVLMLVLLYKYLNPNNRQSGIPGPKKYPIVGSALQINQGRLLEQFYEFARRYGDIFELQLFNNTNIVLNSADMVNKAFCADGYKQVFNDRPAIFIGDRVFMRKNITNPDKLHADLRKALSKGLHVYGDGIPKFENVIKTEIHRVMAQIEATEGREFEFVDLAKRSISNVISILLIGDQATETDVTNFFDILSGQDFFIHPFMNAILLNFPIMLNIPRYKDEYDKVMLARQKIVEKYFYAVKESRKPGIIHGLVDWYLEEQQKEVDQGKEPLLKDEVIIANMLDILSAAIITTAATLPSAMLCLVNHPGYQTKIQQEVDRIVGTDREPTVNDRHNCHFLEAVVMETLRYLLPSPLSLPHVCSKDVEFEGYFVKANTQVLPNIWYIHHAESVWGDPWVFRPERFLGEDGKLLSNTHVNMKSWLPFGIGRRKCPGNSLAMARIFLYLASLLQKWTFTPAPGKCGSCDPRGDSFDCHLLFKPYPFHVIATKRM